MNPHAPNPAEEPGSSDTLEALLRSIHRPAPGEAFRARVLLSMEDAAEEHGVTVAEHRLPTPSPRSGRLEVAAIATAGVLVLLLVMASMLAEPKGSDAGTGTDAVAVQIGGRSIPSDEPPDVHHALELLDARRDLFAVVTISGPLRDAF